MAGTGDKYLRLWRRTKTRRLTRVPFPILIAIELMKERYGIKAFEDMVYEIIKRDPEAKEIIRYVLTGEGRIRLKGEPTLEEEIAETDD